MLIFYNKENGVSVIRKSTLFLVVLFVVALNASAQVVFSTPRELALLAKQIAQAARRGNPLYIPGARTVGKTGLYSFQVSRKLRHNERLSLQIARAMSQELDRKNLYFRGAVPVCGTILQRSSLTSR